MHMPLFAFTPLPTEETCHSPNLAGQPVEAPGFPEVFENGIEFVLPSQEMPAEAPSTGPVAELVTSQRVEATGLAGIADVQIRQDAGVLIDDAGVLIDQETTAFAGRDVVAGGDIATAAGRAEPGLGALAPSQPKVDTTQADPLDVPPEQDQQSLVHLVQAEAGDEPAQDPDLHEPALRPAIDMSARNVAPIGGYGMAPAVGIGAAPVMEIRPASDTMTSTTPTAEMEKRTTPTAETEKGAAPAAKVDKGAAPGAQKSAAPDAEVEANAAPAREIDATVPAGTPPLPAAPLSGGASVAGSSDAGQNLTRETQPERPTMPEPGEVAASAARQPVPGTANLPPPDGSARALNEEFGAAPAEATAARREGGAAAQPDGSRQRPASARSRNQVTGAPAPEQDHETPAASMLKPARQDLRSAEIPQDHPSLNPPSRDHGSPETVTETTPAPTSRPSPRRVVYGTVESRATAPLELPTSKPKEPAPRMPGADVPAYKPEAPQPFTVQASVPPDQPGEGQQDPDDRGAGRISAAGQQNAQSQPWPSATAGEKPLADPVASFVAKGPRETGSAVPLQDLSDVSNTSQQPATVRGPDRVEAAAQAVNSQKSAPPLPSVAASDDGIRVDARRRRTRVEDPDTDKTGGQMSETERQPGRAERLPADGKPGATTMSPPPERPHLIERAVAAPVPDNAPVRGEAPAREAPIPAPPIAPVTREAPAAVRAPEDAPRAVATDAPAGTPDPEPRLGDPDARFGDLPAFQPRPAPAHVNPVDQMPPPRHDQGRSVALQIADVVLASGDRAMELRLQPEELGRVSLTMSQDSGGLSVSLAIERPETLELVRRHIDTLASELRRLGYGNVTFAFDGGGSGPGGQRSPAPAIAGEPDGSGMPASQELVRADMAAPTSHARHPRAGMDLRM